MYNSIIANRLSNIFRASLSLASYFCYDNPGALQNYFMKDMDMSTTQFVWLYSIYSWPNVVLCFIGGFLMDRLVPFFFFQCFVLIKFSFPEITH